MTRAAAHENEMKNASRSQPSAALPPPPRDPVMLHLHTRIEQFARLPPRVNVLILGETGVGKEELANVIHRASNRREGPFVVVNCGAIAESLFEREVFGHKKGAFTHATSDAPGYFELAQGGTLLLDEIGELPRALQCKLLRIVEDRRVFRVGDPKPRPLDVRIIAATNQDLEACVTQGTFRSDLYQRLKAIELHVPPLRARPDDIIPLAEYLLDDERRGFGLSKSVSLSRETIDCLLGYDYPGNVRELRHALSSAILQCSGEMILPEHLPRRMTDRGQMGSSAGKTGRRERQRAIESELILWALEQTAGNQTRAAKMIGMPLRTFVARLDRLGIPRPKKMTAHMRGPMT